MKSLLSVCLSVCPSVRPSQSFIKIGLLVVDPVQKRMTFLHFFYIFFFKTSYFVKYCKKKNVRNRLNFYLQKKTRFIGQLCGSAETFLLREKIRLIFAWLTFTLSFCKGIVKDLVKQIIWFVAYWFLKHDIWTCFEKLRVNVIFLWIAPVFHSFLFFLT